jgi:hypothetical protein
MDKITLSAKATQIALSKKMHAYPFPNEAELITKMTQIYTHVLYIKIESEYNHAPAYLPLEFITENEMLLNKIRFVLLEYKIVGNGQLIQTTKDHIMDLIKKDEVYVTSQTKGSAW